jgi:hypothetical protein
MNQNAWEERGRALEDEFFRRQSQELLERLKRESAHDLSMKELAQVTGIQDEAVLASLVKAGIKPSMAMALTLAPLVFVAWADGHVDEKERKAVLFAAQSVGINPGQDSHELLASWLDHEPEPGLHESWLLYISGMRDILGEAGQDKLKKDVMERATNVAKAAGSFLGFGKKISDAESKVLSRIETAFSADTSS